MLHTAAVLFFFSKHPLLATAGDRINGLTQAHSSYKKNKLLK